MLPLYQPPGYEKDWHVGVRAKTGSRALAGFISGVPASIAVHSKKVPMVEINFLCVHKALRSKRLAPLLIKEVTRRVNLKDIWQAVYTAGIVIPKVTIVISGLTHLILHIFYRLPISPILISFMYSLP